MKISIDGDGRPAQNKVQIGPPGKHFVSRELLELSGILLTDAREPSSTHPAVRVGEIKASSRLESVSLADTSNTQKLRDETQAGSTTDRMFDLVYKYSDRKRSPGSQELVEPTEKPKHIKSKYADVWNAQDEMLDIQRSLSESEQASGVSTPGKGVTRLTKGSIKNEAERISRLEQLMSRSLS